MKREELCDSIGLLEEELIRETEKRRLLWKEKQEARPQRTERKKPGVKWMAAAGFALVMLGGMWLFWQAPGLKSFWSERTNSHQEGSDSGERTVQQWSEGFPAERYFAYNEEAKVGSSGQESTEESSTDSLNSLSEAQGYRWERDFSGKREEMEENGWIPRLADYPLFSCTARYQEAGSLYSLTFSWHKRGAFEDYKDISITAGFQEIKEIEDCIVVEVDEEGQIVPPLVTVTERDGIPIVARGREKRDKTLTFQNQTGWYQIEGCWNNGYEELADLLDWLWEHPVDFSRFPIEKGDQFEIVTRKEQPKAFLEWLPNFYALGFTEAEAHVVLKNGEPYNLEGHYIGRVAEEVVLAGDYYDEEEWTEVHWCITTEPNVYEKEESIGKLEDLTEEATLELLEENRKLVFWWNGYLITVYINADEKAAEDAWRVIRSQQEAVAR